MTNQNLTWTIEALRQGHPKAFEALYAQYYRALCAFSAQYIPLAEAEEVVQDTMLWLWEHRDLLDEALSVKTLLFTIVKNKSLNLVTHEEIRRRVHQEIEEKYREKFNDPDLYTQQEIFALYRQALGKLSEEVRKAFEMNRSQHLTHKEIAERLGVSPQTINYRIGQALRLLRRELKDFLPFALLILSLQLPSFPVDNQQVIMNNYLMNNE